MKKIYIFLTIIFSIFMLCSLDVKAYSIKEDDIPNGTYIIGKHMFTRDTLGDYKGQLTTKYIMLGSGTIQSTNPNDMIIYYKNPRGQWKDAVTEKDIIPKDIYDIEYENVHKYMHPPQTVVSYTNYNNTNYTFNYTISVPSGEYAIDPNANPVLYNVDGWKLYKLDANGTKEYNGNRYSLVHEGFAFESYSSTIELGKTEEFIAVIYDMHEDYSGVRDAESDPVEISVNGLVANPIDVTLTNGIFNNNSYTYTVNYDLQEYDGTISNLGLNLKQYIKWEMYSHVYGDDYDIQLPNGFKFKLVDTMNTNTPKTMTFNDDASGTYVFRYYIEKSNGQKVYSEFSDIVTVSKTPTPKLYCGFESSYVSNGVAYNTYVFGITNANTYNITNNTTNNITHSWQLSKALDDGNGGTLYYQPVAENLSINYEFTEGSITVPAGQKYLFNATVTTTIFDGSTTYAIASLSSNDCIVK